MTKLVNSSKLEIWEDIPNYEGIYQISNLGNVRSLYDLSNNFIKEYDSLTDASKQFKTISNISLCCKGRYKQAYGYIWKFKGGGINANG